MAENTDKPKPTYLHCKMSADMLEALDSIARHHGINDRSTAVRMLIKAEERRIAPTEPPAKKTARPSR